MPENPYEPPQEVPLHEANEEHSAMNRTGFLANTNPDATPRSALIWAVMGSIPGPLLILFGVPAITELSWLVKIPILAAAAALGAGIAAIVEWQID